MHSVVESIGPSAQSIHAFTVRRHALGYELNLLLQTFGNDVKVLSSLATNLDDDLPQLRVFHRCQSYPRSPWLCFPGCEAGAKRCLAESIATRGRGGRTPPLVEIRATSATPPGSSTSGWP